MALFPPLKGSTTQRNTLQVTASSTIAPLPGVRRQDADDSLLKQVLSPPFCNRSTGFVMLYPFSVSVHLASICCTSFIAIMPAARFPSSSVCARECVSVFLQDRKDVERDTFIVNGCFVRGSDGYDTVVSVVTDALLEEDASLSQESANEMAVQVCSCVCAWRLMCARELAHSFRCVQSAVQPTPVAYPIHTVLVMHANMLF
jgi:hypothetical protein